MLWGAGKMQNAPWGGFDHLNNSISATLDQHICTPKHIDTIDEGLHIAGGITSYLAPAGTVAKLMSFKTLATSSGVVAGANTVAFGSDLAGTILFPDQIMEEPVILNTSPHLQQIGFN